MLHSSVSQWHLCISVTWCVNRARPCLYSTFSSGIWFLVQTVMMTGHDVVLFFCCIVSFTCVVVSGWFLYVETNASSRLFLLMFSDCSRNCTLCVSCVILRSGFSSISDLIDRETLTSDAKLLRWDLEETYVWSVKIHRLVYLFQYYCCPFFFFLQLVQTSQDASQCVFLWKHMQVFFLCSSGIISLQTIISSWFTELVKDSHFTALNAPP